MGIVTAQKGKWGFLTDVVYLNISKSKHKPLTPPPILTNVKIKASIVTSIAYLQVHTS